MYLHVDVVFGKRINIYFSPLLPTPLALMLAQAALSFSTRVHVSPRTPRCKLPALFKVSMLCHPRTFRNTMLPCCVEDYRADGSDPRRELVSVGWEARWRGAGGKRRGEEGRV